MGTTNALRVARSIVMFCALVFAGAGSVGCQLATPQTSRAIIHQQAVLLDLTGLVPPQTVELLDVNWAVPRDWEKLPLRRTPLYTHQQFRSPSGLTAVGVAHIRLPLPFSTQTLAWLVKKEYTKRLARGNGAANLLARWSDEIGREWFVAENGKYHASGYIQARGLGAWIVYSGYRLSDPPQPVELGIATRSAQTVSPQP